MECRQPMRCRRRTCWLQRGPSWNEPLLVNRRTRGSTEEVERRETRNDAVRKWRTGALFIVQRTPRAHRLQLGSAEMSSRPEQAMIASSIWVFLEKQGPQLRRASLSIVWPPAGMVHIRSLGPAATLAYTPLPWPGGSPLPEPVDKVRSCHHASMSAAMGELDSMLGIVFAGRGRSLLREGETADDCRRWTSTGAGNGP